MLSWGHRQQPEQTFASLSMASRNCSAPVMKTARWWPWDLHSGSRRLERRSSRAFLPGIRRRGRATHCGAPGSQLRRGTASPRIDEVARSAEPIAGRRLPGRPGRIRVGAVHSDLRQTRRRRLRSRRLGWLRRRLTSFRFYRPRGRSQPPHGGGCWRLIPEPSGWDIALIRVHERYRFVIVDTPCNEQYGVLILVHLKSRVSSRGCNALATWQEGSSCAWLLVHVEQLFRWAP